MGADEYYAKVAVLDPSKTGYRMILTECHPRRKCTLANDWGCSYASLAVMGRRRFAVREVAVVVCHYDYGDDDGDYVTVATLIGIKSLRAPEIIRRLGEKYKEMFDMYFRLGLDSDEIEKEEEYVIDSLVGIAKMLSKISDSYMDVVEDAFGIAMRVWHRHKPNIYNLFAKAHDIAKKKRKLEHKKKWDIEALELSPLKEDERFLRWRIEQCERGGFEDNKYYEDEDEDEYEEYYKEDECDNIDELKLKYKKIVEKIREYERKRDELQREINRLEEEFEEVVKEMEKELEKIREELEGNLAMSIPLDPDVSPRLENIMPSTLFTDIMWAVIDATVELIKEKTNVPGDLSEGISVIALFHMMAVKELLQFLPENPGFRVVMRIINDLRRVCNLAINLIDESKIDPNRRYRSIYHQEEEEENEENEEEEEEEDEEEDEEEEF